MPDIRVSVADICYGDALRRAGLMIVGVSPTGIVLMAERRLMLCGHPESCDSERGCRACEMGIPGEVGV